MRLHGVVWRSLLVVGVLALLTASFLLIVPIIKTSGPAIKQDAATGDASWEDATRAYAEAGGRVGPTKSAIELLPTGDARTISFVVETQNLLSSGDWWIRTTAAAQLGKITAPELRERLRSYARSPAVKVREGILAALSAGTDPQDIPVIVEALADPAWQVQRMACWAAGRRRAREAVAPMIRMMVDDALHPRIRGVLLFNLQEITGQTQLAADPASWQEYWERSKDQPLPDVVRFRVRDFGKLHGVEFNDTFARNGTAPLAIVLPDVGKTTVYYMPYLPQLSCLRWLFVNLPPLASFSAVPRDEHGEPIYPVGDLVDALDDIGRTYDAGRVVIVAQGFTAPVAALYAETYPDRTGGLILLDPYGSDNTYAKAIEAAAHGSPDAQLWARDRSGEQPARTPSEREICSYCADSWWLSKRNRDDMELGVLRTIWRDPGRASVPLPTLGPSLDLEGKKPMPTPALIYLPAKDNELMTYGDLYSLQRVYPKNVIVKGGQRFAYLPFLEDPDLFEQALLLFTRH